MKTHIVFFSVRAKIQDGVDNHNTFDDYWIRCLYEGEQGDPEDVEKGFLKGILLVKVRILPPCPQDADPCQIDFSNDLYFAFIRPMGL